MSPRPAQGLWALRTPLWFLWRHPTPTMPLFLCPHWDCSFSRWQEGAMDEVRPSRKWGFPRGQDVYGKLWHFVSVLHLAHAEVCLSGSSRKLLLASDFYFYLIFSEPAAGVRGPPSCAVTRWFPDVTPKKQWRPCLGRHDDSLFRGAS